MQRPAAASEHVATSIAGTTAIEFDVFGWRWALCRGSLGNKVTLGLSADWPLRITSDFRIPRNCDF